MTFTHKTRKGINIGTHTYGQILAYGIGNCRLDIDQREDGRRNDRLEGAIRRIVGIQAERRREPDSGCNLRQSRQSDGSKIGAEIEITRRRPVDAAVEISLRLGAIYPLEPT